MSIVVRIRLYQMEAITEVSRQEGESLTIDAIKQALEGASVCHGVDDDACLALVHRVNNQPPGTHHRHCLAHGSPPINGEDGSMEMAVEYNRNLVGLPDESDTIDVRERGSFTSIAKDALIARIVLPTVGVDGRNVRGESLLAIPGQRAAVDPGPGTDLFAGGTQLRATRSGDLYCLDGRIEVMDEIRVAGNLD